MPPIHRPQETAELVRRAFGSSPVPVGELEAIGVSRKRMRSAVAAGTLQQVRRGVVRAPGPEHGAGGQDPWGRATLVERQEHLCLARAALLGLADGSVVSHGSAALITGLPTYRRAGIDVWVTAPRHGRVVAGTHRRLGSIDPVDVVEVEGVPCTGPARTALDLARRQPPHVALVALDAAAAQVGSRELRAAMARLEWVYDLAQLSSALALVDPLSESPLESISRGWMHDCGVPRPRLQQWVHGASGRRYRVDFLWSDALVIGEADGMSKYATIDDVRAEKRREDDLRRAGYVIVRWTYQELLSDPMAVMLRIQRALNEQP